MQCFLLWVCISCITAAAPAVSVSFQLIVWNAELEAKVNLVSLKMAWVMTCAYEPTSQELVACGGLDNVCSVYKLKAVGSSIIRPDIELRGHDGYLSCCRFVSTSQILTASGDSTCVLWDINRREKIKDFTDHGGDVMRCVCAVTCPCVYLAGVYVRCL
jgi:guanine nucleotide-binding protein G(I)/G(S)/G(T) subunit beta-1